METKAPETPPFNKMPNPLKAIKQGILCCYKCGDPFPSNHSFFIKIDEDPITEEDGTVHIPIFTGIQTQNLICVPCVFKGKGIDPEARNRAKREKLGITPPNIPRIIKKEKKLKKKSDTQPSLF